MEKKELNELSMINMYIKWETEGMGRVKESNDLTIASATVWCDRKIKQQF